MFIEKIDDSSVVMGVVIYPMLTDKAVDAGIFWFVVMVTVLENTEQELMLIPVMVHSDSDDGTSTSEPIMIYIFPPF